MTQRCQDERPGVHRVLSIFHRCCSYSDHKSVPTLAATDAARCDGSRHYGNRERHSPRRLRSRFFHYSLGNRNRRQRRKTGRMPDFRGRWYAASAPEVYRSPADAIDCLLQRRRVYIGFALMLQGFREKGSHSCIKFLSVADSCSIW